MVTRTKWSQLSRDSEPKPYRSSSARSRVCTEYICFLTHRPRVHFKSTYSGHARVNGAISLSQALTPQVIAFTAWLVMHQRQVLSCSSKALLAQ